MSNFKKASLVVTVILAVCSCVSINASNCRLIEANNSKSLYKLTNNSLLAANTNPQQSDNNQIQPKDIDWKQDKSLKLKKIDVDVARVYYKGVDIPGAGLSGMAITDKYIVFAQITKNENNTFLTFVDKDTFEVLDTVDSHCFGHANDMAFNDKTGEILIVKGPKQIVKFKVDDSGGKFRLYNLKYIDSPRTYSGISYDEKNDRYMGYCAGKMYVMDNQFHELYNFNLIRGLVPQGMTYKDGEIYYSCYETGKPNTTYRVYNSKEKDSNVIYVYDLNGKLKRTLYIPNTSANGEIENLDFRDNGNLLLGYNKITRGKRTATFYESNLK